jgi:predicted Zn-dependent peptidase
MRFRQIPGALTIVMLLLAGTALGEGVTLPDYQRIELDNGVVLLLHEQRDVPLVALSAMLRGGAAADPEDLNGLAALFAALLEKGAGDRDAAGFAETIDSVGGRLSASAGIEHITIAGDFLSRDAGLMVGLVADMLLRPALDEGEFEKLRERSINFILAAKDTNLNAVLPIYGHAFLFGDHPYGNPVGGSEATLANIKHADLVDYYEQQVGGDRLILSVSGDFDATRMAAELTDAFGSWRPAADPLAEIPPAGRRPSNRVLLIDKPGATQTYFWIGNVGVARDFDRRAALDVVNTLFGGRYTSMLNDALRVQSGLTYGARSTLLRPSTPGSLAITSYTRTDSTVEAIDMALGVLGQLRDGRVDVEVIDSSRNYILGQFPTALETAAQLGSQLAILEMYGLGRSYIDDYGAEILAVNRDAAIDVIGTVYSAAEELVFVILGDAELIRDSVNRYGPVMEIGITEPTFRPPDEHQAENDPE